MRFSANFAYFTSLRRHFFRLRHYKNVGTAVLVALLTQYFWIKIFSPGKITCVLDLLHPFLHNTPMIIASCLITLELEAVFSLKEKRSIVKSILNRLPQKFNVAVAEVDQQDVWGTAVIGLVTVGNDAAHLHSQLQKAVTWLESHRPDVPIADYEIEILS